MTDTWTPGPRPPVGQYTVTAVLTGDDIGPTALGAVIPSILAANLPVSSVHIIEIRRGYPTETPTPGTTPGLAPDLRRLISDLTDADPCHFDHHGGCQAHGYLSLEPGELCPHAEAKQLLNDNPEGGSHNA